MKMEQNLPIIAKKVWSIVRVMLYMLKKNISKANLIAQLNMLLKRGKLAGGKAIHDLIFHHSLHLSAAAGGRRSQVNYPVLVNEYEFTSCENTPAHPVFHLPRALKRKTHKMEAPPAVEELSAALEIIHSTTASPALPGFGRTPVVKQLRISDSPFPLTESEEDNNHVDEAAENFILRFYSQLRREHLMAP